MAPKTRPSAASVKDSQNTTRLTRKRRASSQRASAPRAKRSRTDNAQVDAEGEDAILDEEEQEVEQHVQVIVEGRSSPAGVLPSSPPVFQTTTLTQQLRETTVQSTPIARPTKSVRGRKSMPAQLAALTSDVEERQFAPIEAIDAHTKRRLSRNHMSEEQNEYTTRLHILQKQLRDANTNIQELEFDREADRQMGVANTLDQDKDNEIEKLKREKAQLEEDIAEHRSHQPYNDGEAVYQDDAMVDVGALSAHNENVVVRTTNGVLTYHHPNHVSCRGIVDEYQHKLFKAGKEHAQLTQEAEGLRIRLRNLGFPVEGDIMLDIVSKVHEAFITARTELSRIDLLPDEHFDTMTNEELLPFMTELLQKFREQMAVLTDSETDLQNELLELQTTLDAKLMVNDSLDRDNESLLRDKVQLQGELEESQAARVAKEEELANVIQNFQDEISKLRSEHDEQMSDMQQAMEVENQTRLESEQEKDNQIATLRSQLESASQVQEQAGDTLLDAGINTDALIDGITELRRRRETEQRQREEAERYLDEANDKIETMEAQSAEDNRKMVDLNLEINKFKSDIFGQQKLKEEAIAEKERLIEEHKATVARLENTHGTAMDQEVALRQSIIEDMDKTIAEERETGMKLHRKADSLQEEKQQLEADLDSANTLNEEFDAAIDALKTLVAEKEETIKSLSSDIEEYEDNIQQYETAVQELTAAKAELEATCEQNDLTIQDLTATVQAHEITIAQHEGTIRARDMTIQEDKVTIEEYRETIDHLTTQVTEKDGAMADFEDDLGQLRKKYATSVKKNRHYEAILDAVGQHNQRVSQESQEVSRLVLQRDVLPVGEDEDEEFDELDVTMVGTPDVASVQKTKANRTITTTAQHRSYNLRNGKEHRDSGIVMDSSSPTRQHHATLQEIDE